MSGRQILLLILLTVLVLIAIGAIRPGFASVTPIQYTEVSRTIDGQLLHIDIVHVGELDEETLNTLPGTAAEPFVLTGLKRATIPVVFRYNPLGAPGDFEDHITDGHNGWNGISSNFAYAYGGPNSAALAASVCSGGNPDGQNSINWGPIGGNTLAMACWFSGGADECDQVISTAWDWSTVLGSAIRKLQRL